ncbi:D-alanyl-D-alanine carboxypeptidase family protein [Paenibacillus allorhizosphaerae]|uniref:Carboxypeptidase YodJ n=1 Tax=Paenibacillus allorhizosphaerae TaxID=2849866 RepID=A0ABM8VJM9_9BACL|nr:M15 family metallopeptidase [Paenibacillus allorhizosphaerae]CAG7645147.1 Putative carboxypeptidase YodJ [Paenibacillus allorhizosphaerae]
MLNLNQPWKLAAVVALSGALLLTAGCGGDKKPEPAAADPGKATTTTPVTTPGTDAAAKPGSDTGKNGGTSSQTPATQPSQPTTQQPPTQGAGPKSNTAIQVVANPTDNAVMVNKTYKLPDNYKPTDLVEPDVPFTFKEHLEKRKMRKEAAAALEKLFAAAKKDGLPLAGVSAYRSHETQTTLYNNYVKKDGEEAANKYSAKPGHSEHETGLAIDVSGSTGKCAATDCFADTKEAKWLDQHAPEYGFIIRYPKGKEAITGYQYEPWHLRYVGTETAKDIAKKGVTFEEYMGSSVPVSKPK